MLNGFIKPANRQNLEMKMFWSFCHFYNYGLHFVNFSVIIKCMLVDFPYLHIRSQIYQYLSIFSQKWLDKEAVWSQDKIPCFLSLGLCFLQLSAPCCQYGSQWQKVWYSLSLNDKLKLKAFENISFILIRGTLVASVPIAWVWTELNTPPHSLSTHPPNPWVLVPGAGFCLSGC